MAHAGRTDARERQPIVKPRRRPAAEIRADGMMDRREDLEQHERRSDGTQRQAQARAALHGGDEHAHRHRERHRQQAARDDQHPPGQRQPAIGAGQNGGKRPVRQNLTDLACLNTEHGVLLTEWVRHRFRCVRIAYPFSIHHKTILIPPARQS